MCSAKVNYQSITVPVTAGDHLRLMRFYCDKKPLGQPVFMLHGMFAEGSVFFAQKDGGLAADLATRGYDVFVADLRGKGESWPKINRCSRWGVHQHITEDIPALLRMVSQQRPNTPQIWIGQGWGGVLMAAYAARFVDNQDLPALMVYLGSSRYRLPFINTISQWGFVFRHRLLSALTLPLGYCPSFSGLMNSPETKGNIRDYFSWQRTERWLDPVDGFDYGRAIRQKSLPPSLYLAANRTPLPIDGRNVGSFSRELGVHDSRVINMQMPLSALLGGQSQALLSQSLSSEETLEVLHGWLRDYCQAVAQ